MEKCVECGRETIENKKCEYCEKTFCDAHMPQHMSWERRHEGLAEDSSKLWKRRRRE
jgi:hypothetical protein